MPDTDDEGWDLDGWEDEADRLYDERRADEDAWAAGVLS